ncbi:type VII secretion target [Rhodococcus sp. NPDC059234]|uniref:type VII secretion target n=1 Tax=Rhodococcus sp. NPDC059234 TaxID=3346781 RepID=UPI00366B5BE5
MTQISAVTDGIRAYGVTAETMSAQVRAAAVGAAAAGPAMLGPVFGLIGGDFLVAFASAHGGHAAALRDLADDLGSMSSTAAASALAYDTADLGAADGLDASGKGLEA